MYQHSVSLPKVSHCHSHPNPTPIAHPEMGITMHWLNSAPTNSLRASLASNTVVIAYPIMRLVQSLASFLSPGCFQELPIGIIRLCHRHIMLPPAAL